MVAVRTAVLTQDKDNACGNAVTPSSPSTVGVYKCASSGDIYEGEMQGDRRHGKGVLFFRDGSVYEGDFRGSVAILHR